MERKLSFRENQRLDDMTQKIIKILHRNDMSSRDIINISKIIEEVADNNSVLREEWIKE